MENPFNAYKQSYERGRDLINTQRTEVSTDQLRSILFFKMLDEKGIDLDCLPSSDIIHDGVRFNEVVFCNTMEEYLDEKPIERLNGSPRDLTFIFDRNFLPQHFSLPSHLDYHTLELYAAKSHLMKDESSIREELKQVILPGGVICWNNILSKGLIYSMGTDFMTNRTKYKTTNLPGLAAS